MANRRQLKKTISFIAEEMANELYLKCLLHKNVEEEKLTELVCAIQVHKREFLDRVSHTDSKDPKLVKAYYRALYADWDEAIGKVWAEIEKIS